MSSLSHCLAFIGVISLANCSSSSSTSDIRAGESFIVSNIPSSGTIFEMDEQDAYNIAYSALQEAFPNSNISVITAPSRGYSLVWYSPPIFVDWWRQVVKIYKVTGTSSDNKNRVGYIIATEGSGSSFLQGANKDKFVSQIIASGLQQIGKQYYVKNIQRVDFDLPQRSMYLFGSDVINQ